MRIYKLLFSFIILAIPLMLVSPARAASVTPTFVDGNPTCGALGYGIEKKIEPVTSGTYNLYGTKNVTIDVDAPYVSWESDIGIDAVVVKGGPNANLYVYNPEATSDTTLSAPINPNNDKPYGLSHISFCYDYELEVDKTVKTSLKRTWDWTIEKMLKNESDSELNLAKGQSFYVQYLVKLTANPEDSDWKVWGKITINNPGPVNATITSIQDMIKADGKNNVFPTIDCGVIITPANNYTLPSGETLTCKYYAPLDDGDDRVNYLLVTTIGPVGGDSAQEDVSFASAKIYKEDDCVDVDDDKFGSLGEVCATGTGEFEEEIPYSMEVPSDMCGESEYTNTASFITNTSESTGDSSVTIAIFVDCVMGCTLTQGYWKTHSEFGPAPYDSTWALLNPSGAETTFFLSGMSYHKVMWTPPAGNAYYNLAHQYIAAQMNELNDADMPPAVHTAFNSATTLFNTYTPAQIKALKGNSTLRKQFIDLAGILGSYNEGMKGVPHCDEDIKSL